MKKYIVLHAVDTDKPIIIFVDSICALKSDIDNTTTIIIPSWGQNVKESLGDVMKKLMEVQDADSD